MCIRDRRWSTGRTAAAYEALFEQLLAGGRSV
jgi:hypothetical protein